MTWTRIIRETGLVEWVCEHGVGHPDHESAEKMHKGCDDDEEHGYNPWLIHGCDGCCWRDDFPGRPKYEAKRVSP